MNRNKSAFEITGLQRLLASVDIYEQTILISHHQPYGKTQRRQATVEQAIALLRSGVGQCVWKPVEDGVVSMGFGSDGSHRVLVLRSARRTTLRFRFGKKLRTLRASLPALLGQIRGGREGWTGIERCWAIFGPLKKGTELYLPPLPNMHVDGRVCMGDVSVKRWAKKPAAEFFEAVFVRSEFSDHMAHTALRQKSKYNTVLELLRELPAARMKNQLLKVGVYDGSGQ